jgi:putative tryptophan/tyrosine transport system substrate-binding protein
MIRRREFIARISAAAWPLAARAQQGERVRRVGFLSYNSDTGLSRGPLRDELEQLGWIEGRNLRLDFRFGNGDAAQTRAFAADLVQLAPDVIVASYGLAVRAVQQETKTIPIVVAGAGDLLENGTVKNPAHPEGNVTGFSNLFGLLGGKWMQLLKEVAPNITRVAYLYPVQTAESYKRAVETAAQSLGVQFVGIPVSDPDATKAAIEGFAAERNGGLLLNPAVVAIVPRDELSWLALQYRLPMIYGGLLPGALVNYYGDGVPELIRRAATYVDRLLRGAKVSDLPVQYPTKFRLVINLKTAKALGLEVPSSILVRADEIIE